jgi:hypothetical protein
MDRSRKAHRHWNEGDRSSEPVKNGSAPYGSFYPRAAVRYLFMAEGEEKLAEKQAGSTGIRAALVIGSEE